MESTRERFRAECHIGKCKGHVRDEVGDRDERQESGPRDRQERVVEVKRRERAQADPLRVERLILIQEPRSRLGREGRPEAQIALRPTLTP